MKIVCLGNSFTRGFGVNQNENWVSLSSSMSPHTFVNKGINGDTTSGMLYRFNKDVFLEKPKYVLITGGLNDFICNAQPSMIQPNIMSLVHQSFHYDIIPVIGIEPQCIPSEIRSDLASFTNFIDVYKKHEEYRNWLLSFASTYNIEHIDFYTDFPKLAIEQPFSKYYLDGLHINSKGHELISNIVCDFFN